MIIKIPIKKRNRDFGLFTWGRKDDFNIKTLFKEEHFLNIKLDYKYKEGKKVDYTYRRFSIGRKVIAKHENATHFVVTRKNDIIEINFE